MSGQNGVGKNEQATNTDLEAELAQLEAAPENADNGHRFNIDGMCQGDMIGKFRDCGLADLLH